MAQSHGIDVCSLHQLQVALHQVFRHDAGPVGVVLVAVYAANLDGLTIDEQLSALDADVAEAHLLRDALHGVAVLVFQL